MNEQEVLEHRYRFFSEKGAVSLLLNAKGKYKRGEWATERPMWVEILQDDWEQIRKITSDPGPQDLGRKGQS